MSNTLQPDNTRRTGGVEQISSNITETMDNSFSISSNNNRDEMITNVIIKCAQETEQAKKPSEYVYTHISSSVKLPHKSELVILKENHSSIRLLAHYTH